MKSEYTKWEMKRETSVEAWDIYKTEGINKYVCSVCDTKDAQLIASAPELLEACKYAICEIDNHISKNPMGKTYWPDLRASLANAIRKAERT